MSKVNSGQAPSTLIPEYIGSAFDAVFTCADNINDIKPVSENINDVVTVADNILNVNKVITNVDDVALVADNIAILRYWFDIINIICTCKYSIKSRSNVLRY